MTQVDFAPVIVVIRGNKMVLVHGRVDFAPNLAPIQLSQTQVDFAPVIVEFRGYNGADIPSAIYSRMRSSDKG